MSKVIYRKIPGQCFESHEAPPKILEDIPEPTTDDARSFITVVANGRSEGTIIIHERFLRDTKQGPAGMSCILSTPLEYQSFQYAPNKKTPYDMRFSDIPLKDQKIINCLISPDSDCTVIPMDFGDKKEKNHARSGYLLQQANSAARMIHGYRKNVKFDLIFWDLERNDHDGCLYGIEARRFPIDSAALLDLGPRYKSYTSKNPICLLGMDFLKKYPYLMFVPRIGQRGEVDFILAVKPVFYRSYTTFTEISNKLVIHICSKHNEETGNIGCGVFFKSGSIFNIFSGVSRYDKSGKKYEKNLWERGLLMGIIKALHVVASFPAGHGFTDLTIRTGSPPTNQLLNQHNDVGNDDDSFPSDLVKYIRGNFLRKETPIKVRFEDFSSNEHYDAVEAAGILASGGAKMEEFYLDTSIQKYNLREMKAKYISPLGQDAKALEKLYISFGADGYFKICAKEALKIMEDADKKSYSSLSREDAVFKLGYPAWEGEVAAESAGFLDENRYEFHKLSPVSDLKTLKGILGEDSLKELMVCIQNPGWTTNEIMDIIRGSSRKLKVHEYLAMQTKEYRDEYLKELERKGLEEGWHFCKDKSWNGYLRKNSKGRGLEEWLPVSTHQEKSANNKKWDENNIRKETLKVRSKRYAQILESGDRDSSDTSYHSNYTSESEDISSIDSPREIKQPLESRISKANDVKSLPPMKGGPKAAVHYGPGGEEDNMELARSESDRTYQNESTDDIQSHSSEMWEDSGTCTDPLELIELDLNIRSKTKNIGGSGKVKRRQKTSYQRSEKFYQEPKIFHESWEPYLSVSKNTEDNSPPKKPLGFRKRQQLNNTTEASSNTSTTSWGVAYEKRMAPYKGKMKGTAQTTSEDSTASFGSEGELNIKTKGEGSGWPSFEWALENDFQG